MTNTAPHDPEFQARAERCLEGLLSALDAFDPDELEADLSGGVVRIAFADGGACILNRQAAASQIWMAAGAQAWHFQFDGTREAWLDTKGRGELSSLLAGVLSARLGRAVTL
jgi:CyaY protein